MGKVFVRFLLYIVCFAVSASLFASDLTLDLGSHPHVSLKVATPREIKRSYLQAVGDVSCDRYQQKKGQYVPRGAIELVILCRALMESGLRPKFEFVLSPNYSRSVLMVENGDVHLSSETVWNKDVDYSKVWSSFAVIRDYGLEKGLYAVDGSPAAGIKKATMFDVRRFNGVTIKNWHTDWDVLQDITPKALSVFHFSSIYETLRIGRADFTLLEFPNSDDLKIVRSSLDLYPIEGVKVRLPGSRHFIVSRKFRRSHELHALLNNGLASLRNKGIVDKIYRESGLPNSRTDDWDVINLKKDLKANALN